MLSSIRSIPRRLGGKQALLDVLQQFADAGEDDPHNGLKATLTETDDLEVIFAQIPEGGPYAEVEETKFPNKIEFTYGTCYGGTCGIGATLNPLEGNN
jgi:hypothetical protein